MTTLSGLNRHAFVGLAVALAAATLAFAVAAASPRFFLDSNSAELTLGDSLWAQRNHVQTLDCHGFGRYRSGTIGAEFASFTCAAFDASFDRLGVVSAVTVGPEALRVQRVLAGRFAPDPGVGAIVPRGRFYVSSNDADLALGDSAWAHRNRIQNVSCHGVGAFRQGLIGYEFTAFVCALYNSGFDRLGLVLARTIGPEQVVPTKILK